VGCAELDYSLFRGNDGLGTDKIQDSFQASL
jgi:hypothetical protein